MQPAMIYAPEDTSVQVPLLVALHTWSGDFRQAESIRYLDWCIQQGWAFVHPDYRGPNRTPESGGSDLVVRDVVDAVRYMQNQYNTDSTRIYLIGGSGGGFNALQVLALGPDIWAGVSVFVPITDLEAWYHQTKAAGLRYSDEIVSVTGGIPGGSSLIDAEYKRRSPITHLAPHINTPTDIAAGIRDGHQGSVPISHSLYAFNALASRQDTLTNDFIDYVTKYSTIPEWIPLPEQDPDYPESKRILYRRTSEEVRITLFDGAHDILHEAGLKWLKKQQKGFSVRF